VESRGVLDAFCGIVLAEENIHYSGRPKVLAELYRRIKKKYDVSVWQWWSPSTSVPGSGGWIPADGWVVDPYFMPKDSFRKYIRKYTITGLPVVVMPWASTTAKSKPMTPEQWQANNDQLEIAVEYNLPVAFYWTYGRGGPGGTSCGFGCDRGKPKTEWDRINHWVWNYTKHVRSLSRDYNGLDSADIGNVAPMEIGVTEADKLVYADDFSDSKCIDDASITGFRDLIQDGKKLSARGFRGRETDAVLTYHFAGGFPANTPQALVTATIDKSQHGKVEISLSPDGKSWPRRAVFNKAGKHRLKLSSAQDKQFAALAEFWVRARLSGDPGSQANPAVQIDALRIEAGVLSPKDAVVHLKPQSGTQFQQGKLSYEDDFQTQRYRFTTKRNNDKHLEWRRGAISVRMRPGGSSPTLIWHVEADVPVQNIRVDVSGQANNGSLATNHHLDISIDGKTWSNEVNTIGRKYNVSGWAGHGLTIDLSKARQFNGIEGFYVRLRMRAGSYKEVHPYQSGTIQRIRIEAEVTRQQ